MTDAIFTQPDSVSLLQQTKFQLSFKRLPAVQYFCQKVDLPGANLTVLEQPTPFKNKPIAGNKITYDTLDIEFLLEETMISWKEIHDWMKDLGLETGFKDYNDLQTLSNQVRTKFKTKPEVYSDATLTVLSSQNNPRIRFQFHECFPVSLGKVSFDATSSPQHIMSCTCSFAIFYYEMEPING